MKKSLILILVMIATSFQTMANTSPAIELERHGICYLGSDLEYAYSSYMDYKENLIGIEGGGFYKASSRLSCETKNNLTLLLSSAQGLMGTVLAICGAAPEPVFTKSAMAVIALGMGGLTTANVLLRYAPCDNRSEEVVLNDQEAMIVKRMACEYAGGVFDTGKSQCVYLPETGNSI